MAEEHERQYCALYALIGNGITQEQFDQMDRESEDLSRNVCATILFAVLEVEATLNFQGAVRLGADYFNQNVERLSNQVAHPKTKSYKPDDVVTFNDPTIKTARQSVADMKRFLVLFPRTATV